MSKFRRLSDSMYASPQLEVEDLEAAKAHGIALIVNNRPDGEAPEEPQGDAIEAAAHSAGMDYLAIPIGHGGFSEPQVTALRKAIDAANGPMLAYCRSGTRSTFLWALAQAQAGHDPDELAAQAAAAGYDVAPVRPAMDMFAARAR